MLLTQTRCEAQGQVCAQPGALWLHWTRDRFGPVLNACLSRNTWSEISEEAQRRHNIWEEGFVCHKPGGWVLSRQLRLHNTAYFNTSLNEEQAFQFASQWRAVKEGVREEKCSTAGIPFVFSRRALSDKGVVWKYHCVMWLISHRRYCKWLFKTSHPSAPLLALIHLISII